MSAERHAGQNRTHSGHVEEGQPLSGEHEDKGGARVLLRFVAYMIWGASCCAQEVIG